MRQACQRHRLCCITRDLSLDVVGRSSLLTTRCAKHARLVRIAVPCIALDACCNEVAVRALIAGTDHEKQVSPAVALRQGGAGKRHGKRGREGGRKGQGGTGSDPCAGIESVSP